MHKIIVAGSGTEIGKTVVSGILAILMQADYWKPIQCGNVKDSDTEIMRNWLDTTKHFIHPPTYTLKAPLSPHHAARLENISIIPNAIVLPQTTSPLIIESAGGVFVPVTKKVLTIDVFASWQCSWIIVSKHYLGSINHTLLTLDALKSRHIPIIGLIFNGNPNPDSETVILEYSQLPLLGRLLPEININPHILQRYAKQWYPTFSKLIR